MSRPFPINRLILRPLFIFMTLISLAAPSAFGAASEPEPNRSPPAVKEPDRSLDEALNALATGMQALVGLVEKSKDKWDRCQSGASEEAWCLKMKDAFERLEELAKKEPDSTAPPEADPF